MKSWPILFLIFGCAHKVKQDSKPKAVVPHSLIMHEEEGCGLAGSIENRVQDCDEKKENFVLVMRRGREEVYQDTKSGLLWGPRLNYETNFYGAGKVCGEMELINIDYGIQWRLPSLDEYRAASQHGLQLTFSDMDHWFWTSSFKGRKLRKFTPINMWKGMDGGQGQNFAEEAASVRCIGRVRK